MLNAILETDSVGSLINVFENRYALKEAIKDDARRKRMIGKSDYPMPELNKLNLTLNTRLVENQISFVEKLAKKEGPM